MMRTVPVIFRKIKAFGIVSLWIGVLSTAPSSLFGQLFPGLTGEDLVEAIQQNYTPTVLLNDAQTRDTLYSRVYREGDSIACIYSGFKKVLPEDVDPSQWLYEDGIVASSMNLEHGWPQAKGAGDGTLGNRNMYHLFPSRSAINSDRANFPYQDIADPTTQKWYLGVTQQSNIPASNIDAYSEFRTGRFEPRESVKGDIARAMFYFWTIYRDDAVAADPFYFEEQRSFLCAWHHADPIDGIEEERMSRIAFYQGGLDNPFVLDCTLADRCYCPENPLCETSSNTGLTDDVVMSFDQQSRALLLIEETEHVWAVTIRDMLGHVAWQSTIQSNRILYLPQMIPALYVIEAQFASHRITKLVFVP